MDSSTSVASHSLSQPDTPGGTASLDPKGSASTVHKRTYQACLPCRRRKVRCDLGSVDEPGDPPCLRCRREKKDCIFSETRRKRKAEEDGELSPDFIARNKRSSTGLGASNGGENGAIGDIHVDDFGAVDGHGLEGMGDDHEGESFHEIENGIGGSGGAGNSAPRRDGRGANRNVANETAAALFREPITQPNDALRMLVDAASHTELEGRHAAAAAAAAVAVVAGRGSDVTSSGGGPRPGSMNGGTKARTASMTAAGGSGSGLLNRGQPDASAAIDPEIMAMQEAATAGDANDHDQALTDENLALQAWSSLRFVQAGWFTAREAMEYIDFFYKHLAPLTPVRPPDYSSRAAHPTLLNDDPMLTVTLMTIVSRYKELKGPGCKARSFRIHDKLWDYLQGMITRMFWGQEQFGGGFCGAGSGRTAVDMESSRRGLRSLGTVESLLLLSDWLPRSMHFPPGDDANELTAPLPPLDSFDVVEESRKPNASWIEPAIRSDRMCWSLVGMAYTLSWELGVFDSLVESGLWSPGPQEKTWYDPERADRIGRMLLVYVSQTCGRLGYPNMMPSQGNETNYNFLKMDVPPGTYPGPYATITAEDKLQRAWAELTALMRQSNTEMFDSKRRTRESIQSGEYLKFLESWGPRMRDWKSKFEQTEIEPKSRTMLLIEYEYTRTYINSVALQAVVESCADGADGASPANLNTSHTPPALFPSKLIDVHKQNRKYIDELVEAARNVLKLAVNELVAFKALTHAPVRTHFRILSAAMFLLKSFALGAKESEVHTSMALLDKTVNALTKYVIDDVHLSLRIAELLKSLTSSIRKRFVRLAVPSRGTKRSSQTARPSTSAPKTGGSVATQQSSEPRPSTGQGRHQSVHQNGAGQGFSPDSPFHIGSGQADDFYRIFGDSAPPLVDLKDASITIMPPPDFLGALPTAEGYPPTSPHSSTSPTGGSHSPGAAAAAAQKQHRRSMSQAQPPFSPTAGAQLPPFSPLSTNSGGYDWWALDFNPLLNQGNIFHNTHGHSPGATHQQHGSHGHGKQEHEAGDHNDGDGDANRDGMGGPNPWAAGAFGPEISEGLEMLGALGALGYEEGLGGPPGQSGQPW